MADSTAVGPRLAPVYPGYEYFVGLFQSKYPQMEKLIITASPMADSTHPPASKQRAQRRAHSVRPATHRPTTISGQSKNPAIERKAPISPPLELKTSGQFSAVYVSMKSPLSHTSSPVLPSKIEMDLGRGQADMHHRKQSSVRYGKLRYSTIEKHGLCQGAIYLPRPLAPTKRARLK